MLTQYLLLFFVSMIPIVELRGALIIAAGYATANPDFSMVLAYVVCVIGNMLPVPFIYLFARKVLLWGADKKYIGKFFSFCIEKGEKGGKKLQEKAGRGLFIALLLFVGIPLPGTGAWTGTLAASFLDMDFKPTVLAAMGGVLLAGIIMSVASLLGFSALSAVA
ncbi:MAG: small multi-drug export protein [Lachnospiraceae bacterium]|nr:small multi-drug export protein [Lachnospiraceae bacterium]